MSFYCILCRSWFPVNAGLQLTLSCYSHNRRCPCGRICRQQLIRKQRYKIQILTTVSVWYEMYRARYDWNWDKHPSVGIALSYSLHNIYEAVSSNISNSRPELRKLWFHFICLCYSISGSVEGLSKTLIANDGIYSNFLLKFHMTFYHFQINVLYI